MCRISIARTMEQYCFRFIKMPSQVKSLFRFIKVPNSKLSVLGSAQPPGRGHPVPHLPREEGTWYSARYASFCGADLFFLPVDIFFSSLLSEAVEQIGCPELLY